MALSELERARALSSIDNLMNLMSDDPIEGTQLMDELAKTGLYGTEAAVYYFLGQIRGVVYETDDGMTALKRGYDSEADKELLGLRVTDFLGEKKLWGDT